jgi:hypothetical protein
MAAVAAVAALMLAATAQAQVLLIGSSSSAATTTGSTSVAIARPDGSGSNVLLVATLAVRGGSGVTVTPPAGWTLVNRDNAGTAVALATYRRLAASLATEPASYSFGFTAGRAAAVMVALGGADPTTPVGAVNAMNQSGSVSSINAPNITVPAGGSRLLALFAAGSAGSAVGTPSGMAAVGTVNSGGGTAGVRTAVFTQAPVAAAGTGDRSASLSPATSAVGVLLSVSPAPPQLPLYLVASGPLQGGFSTQPPGGSLANHDPERDDFAGLLLAKGGSGANETDPTKFQAWRASSGGTVLSGTVRLTLWSAMKDFATDKDGLITAYLRDCDAGFTSCSLVGEVTRTLRPWHGAATWRAVDLDFTGLSRTLAANRRLELKVVVNDRSDDDMWLAYDAAAQASVLGPPSTAVASVNHYQVSLPSTSLSCLPTAVTVTACANASSPCTSAATGVNGATAMLTTSAGTLASGTLTFNASGVASTTLTHPGATAGQAVSVTLSGESVAATAPRRCCPDGAACSDANSCSTTFQTAGFVVAAGVGGAATTLPAVTAGSMSGPWVLRAVRSSSNSPACEAALSGATTVDWAYECQDPAICAASNLLRIDGGTATPVARNDSGAVASWTAVPMNFDSNGNAGFSFRHDDVGRLTLRARKTVGGAMLSGASNAFVSRPAGFTITALAQTAAPNTANPGATSASDGRFVAAGEAFGASVTAITGSGAPAPSFGREAVPEGVRIETALVLPAGGATGTLSNDTVAGSGFAAGVARVANLAYSEVGIITLRPRLASGSYLGSGDVPGTASGNVGRFVPARLERVTATLTHRASLACTPASDFSYLGENLRLVVTLRAVNAAGAVTTNYRGDFARFSTGSASAWGLAGIAGTTPFTSANGRLSLGSASGSWSLGVLTDAQLVWQPVRGSAPEGPYTLNLGIAPTDADGVGLAGHDLDTDSPANGADRTQVASADLRFGRLRLFSAAGAADRALALPLQAEHWAGGRFVVNTDDSCTAVPATAVSRGRLRGGLLAADAAPLAGVTLASGRGQLRLAAPGGGRRGGLDLALSLGSAAADASCLAPWTPSVAATAGAGLAALRANLCSSGWSHDPAARASFGRPRSSGLPVDRRERF